MARVDTPGIGRKSDFCYSNCSLANVGNGIVYDHCGKNPVIAFLMSSPTKADALARKPLTSYKGLFYYTVLKPNRLTMDDVIISHILRCNNWKYPIGASRRKAELACRNFDNTARGAEGQPLGATGLYDFAPNWFTYTFSLSDARNLEAYQALMMADIERALRFARSGFRPLVTMGQEAMELLAPWHTGQGGLKRFRADWSEGNLPWSRPKPSAATYRKDLISPDQIMSVPVKRPPAAVQTKLFD